MYRVVALALVLLLVPAASVGAADHGISVGNNFFSPPDAQVAVGDTVTWTFSEAGNHDIQSKAGEEESFDSDPANPNPFHAAGYKFSYTFNKDSVAVDYFCSVHPSEMSGTITVGAPPPPPPDTVAPRISSLRAKLGKRKVKISFRLDEGARVVLKLVRTKRPNRTLRTVTRNLGTGSDSISLRRRGLDPGRYRATLTARDDAGNESPVARASFRLS